MKLDQEEIEFFERRRQKKPKHALFVLIFVLILLTGGLYAVFQQKNNRPTIRELPSALQAEPRSDNALGKSQIEQKDKISNPVKTTSSGKLNVYKCSTTDGRISYGESACDIGTTSKLITIQDNVIDSSFLRKKIQLDLANTSSMSSSELKKNDGLYMSDYDVKKRIKELEMDLKSITSTREKLSAARIEINILKSKKALSLSFEDENERAGLRRLLNSYDEDIRYKSHRKLLSIYAKYS